MPNVPVHKHLSQVKFEGKMYFDSGAGDSEGDSSSGKRVNDHFLRIDGQVNGKPDDSEDFKLSDDGKTLTIVTRVVKSSAVFTAKSWGLDSRIRLAKLSALLAMFDRMA